MYTKADIYNLALGALLLSKTISDIDSDTSSECRTLNVHWKAAFNSTLQDLDLDGTSSIKTLELLEENPNDLWLFAYKYPVKCAFFRRIQNGALMDKRSNQISKRVGIHDGKKVIFTNQEEAIAEIISEDVPLSSLSANAGVAIAYKLAMMSAPLIAGKGAKDLKKQIMDLYLIAKGEAQEIDRLENSNFLSEEDQSEFVEARMS